MMRPNAALSGWPGKNETEIEMDNATIIKLTEKTMQNLSGEDLTETFSRILHDPILLESFASLLRRKHYIGFGYQFWTQVENDQWQKAKTRLN